MMTCMVMVREPKAERGISQKSDFRHMRGEDE